MAEKFNPLKSWLGISTSGKPSYYDLIGLANFETEPPIIADAADSAIAKVSENLGGEHHAAAEKLVRDLKGLKGVLLSADKRRAYDEQLRNQLGIAAPPKPAAPLLPGMSPHSLEAADSPTMMLPPGALSALRSSLDQVLNSAPPAAQGYGAQPNFPPGSAPAPAYGALPQGGLPPGAPPQGAPSYGALPQGAPPYGAPGYGAPGYGGQQAGAQPYGGQAYGAPQPNGPQYGDPQYGGQQPQYGAPVGHAPNPYQQQAPYGADPNAGYNPNAGYPNNGYGAPMGAGPMAPNQGFEQPGFGGNPYGAPGMGGPAMGGPNLGLGGPSPLPGDPMGFNAPAPAGTLPRAPAPRTRARVAAPAKSQLSNVTLALLVLGGAAAVLAVVIIVVQKNKGNNLAVAIKTPTRDTMNKPLPPMPPVAGVPLRTPFEAGPPKPRAKLPGEDVAVSIDVSKEMDRRERMNQAMNTDTLVPKMLPEGAKPAMGTPAGTVPTTSSPPTTTMTPEKKTPEPLGGVDGLKGVVVAQVAMEPALPEDAVRAKSVPTMLKGGRASLQARDYNKAEEMILLAQITADTPTLVKRSIEHGRALDLMRGFWTSVRDGIKTLKAGDEVTLAAKTGTVVKHDEVSLVVKLDGKDVPLLIDKLVPALAVQMAERAIGKDAPGAKLVLGTFLVLDQGADHARGFTLIDEAAGGDIIVGDYLEMLQAKD
ncbi:MAG: hypothetical protein K8U03_16640 [Planctomycetia bacterium]|nr:hypothetical protein [Planctomycetia bacterium]